MFTKFDWSLVQAVGVIIPCIYLYVVWEDFNTVTEVNLKDPNQLHWFNITQETLTRPPFIAYFSWLNVERLTGVLAKCIIPQRV